MHYQVAIIGAGVAGASALLALQKSGLNIALIAPKQQPAFRIGETLPPVAKQELIELGVWENFVRLKSHIKCYAKFSAWGSAHLREQLYTGHADEHAWALDRPAFNQFLLDSALARCPLTYIEDKVTSAQRHNGNWSIHLKKRPEAVSASLLVDATGRAAVVSRNVHQRHRLDKMICVYTTLFQQDKSILATPGPLVEAVADGWWYTALLPGQRLLLSFFTDSDLFDHQKRRNTLFWEKQLAQSMYTQKRIISAGFSKKYDFKLVDAATIITDEIATSDFFAIGDAAACFDPLSSHGITTALWSGRKAAAAIEAIFHSEPAAFRAYAQSFQEGMHQFLNGRYKMYSAEQRFRNSPFWQRRHKQVPSAFY